MSWLSRRRSRPRRFGLALTCVAGLAVAGMAAGCATPKKPPLPRAASTVATPSTSAAAAPSGSPARSPSGPAPASVDAHAPAGFVALSDVDSTILQDIRYATDHNFVGRPITGYLDPMCILTREAADALRRVQTAARARGYSLKVYDCYRPQRAVDDFVRWAQSFDDQRMKAEFYPRTDKLVLSAEGYIAGPTAHSRGSTMDLTLVALPSRAQRPYVPGEQLTPCYAPDGQRFPDNSVDMGTGFDCFDSLAHTLDPRVTGQPMANRLLLKQLMGGQGFANYANEWWHYTLAGEPYARTYFDFPVARAALSGG